jgi:hypothetical protein
MRDSVNNQIGVDSCNDGCPLPFCAVAFICLILYFDQFVAKCSRIECRFIVSAIRAGPSRKGRVMSGDACLICSQVFSSSFPGKPQRKLVAVPCLTFLRLIVNAQ